MAQPRILVVEDNPVTLQGIQDLLEISGFEVVTANDGRQGLEALETQRPDLIISDIMMPGIDGYQFHAQIQKQSELLGIPFIFLTARGEKDDIRRGKALGVDDYITKPFDDEDLLVTVRAKLSRWEDLRKLREEQIAEFKRNILLALSHEFRTPLSYIINYTDMFEIEGEAIKPGEFRQFMQGIRKGALRLNRLVEDFITLVELETGEARNVYLIRRHQITDTSAWLQGVGLEYQTAAESHGLKILIDIPEGLPPLEADVVYLEDAISRLIDNAIKFSRPESEWVRLKAEVESDKLLVKVEDQGIGISTNEMESLFNIFHQIDRATREQRGTGSGLAICKGLVDLHGGKVMVESEHGVGSVFWIELPLKKT
jgi:two-component system sensor histidine kinase/response regulator